VKQAFHAAYQTEENGLAWIKIEQGRKAKGQYFMSSVDPFAMSNRIKALTRLERTRATFTMNKFIECCQRSNWTLD